MTTPHQEPPHQSDSGQAPPVGTETTAGAETTTAKAVTVSARKSVLCSQWAFAAVGLGVGLVGGLALGQLEFEATSDAIPTAVEACGVKDGIGINVGDGGQSISMQTEGMESVGATYTDVVCVLEELGVSDSVTARMETTRALDGRLSGTWDGFSASWGYHPDSGLNIVVETTEPN
ncbi:MAG TPA: hypothetical protein VFI97_06405 [Arthrobacter sp.]|nr:hypothetical protein [Arthrobacter sp.]